MRPDSITRMRSASRMVDRRCAMTKLVRSERKAAIARWTRTSVRGSTELVASSRIRSAGSPREARPQLAAPHPGDHAPVQCDPPGVQLIEPHDEVDQGGFSGACRTNDCNRVSRLGHEGQVLDQRLVREVSERNILELDS